MLSPRFINLVAFFALLPLMAVLSLPKLTGTSIVGAQSSGGTAQLSGGTDGSWLDRKLVNWNSRMSALPHPVASTSAADAKTHCRDYIRQPESPAENALVRAGWMPYGAVKSIEQTRVITAMSGVDGMCRPLGYQAFVYWEGRYAGTLSPAAMDSRTDGAITNIQIVSPTRITAEFARYKETDPLCCPSRISYVTYEVDRDDAPLVTPVSVNTRPTGGPGEVTSAGNDDATGIFGRKWRLTEVRGVPIKITTPYIEFDRDAKRYSGSGGCNRFFGSFEVNGTNLKLSQGGSTRMMCVGDEQKVEESFFRALKETTRFQIEDKVLRLYAGDSQILTFKDSASEAGKETEMAKVSGTVTYLQRMAIAPNAVVEVRLLDVSQSPEVTIAEQIIKPAGRQVPFEFELSYDPRHIDKQHSYAIQASILEEGKPIFINKPAYPVNLDGQTNRVNVIVKPVQ